MDVCQVLNSAVKLTEIWKEDNIELICLLILVKTVVAINLIRAQSFSGLDVVMATRFQAQARLWRQDFLTPVNEPPDSLTAGLFCFF